LEAHNLSEIKSYFSCDCEDDLFGNTLKRPNSITIKWGLRAVQLHLTQYTGHKGLSLRKDCRSNVVNLASANARLCESTLPKKRSHRGNAVDLSAASRRRLPR